jgi:hypothetical protein
MGGDRVGIDFVEFEHQLYDVEYEQQLSSGHQHRHHQHKARWLRAAARPAQLRSQAQSREANISMLNMTLRSAPTRSSNVVMFFKFRECAIPH